MWIWLISVLSRLLSVRKLIGFLFLLLISVKCGVFLWKWWNSFSVGVLGFMY